MAITKIADNIGMKNGNLTFAGQDTVMLANKYGTPLYLMDEGRIRNNCKTYLDIFQKCFPEGSKVLYASKACSFMQMYRIVKEEAMGIDVVSPGEIETAFKAGYDMSQAYFHGNAKTDADITFAFDRGIGTFVVDNPEELYAVEAEAASRGIKQRIMLRVTPGIDPHTYEAVATGKVDSKFGSAVETGQAYTFTKQALDQPHLDLVGFHCHVGSQVFEEHVYERTITVMTAFMADIQKQYGFVTKELNLGGGFGVPYVDSDGMPDVPNKVKDIADALHSSCKKH